MDPISNLWTFRGVDDFFWKSGIYLIGSIVFVWVFACILSRIKIAIKGDAELKVWFGCLISLSFYAILSSGYVLLVASAHYGSENFLIFIMPFFFWLILVLALVLSLSNKIRDKLDIISE
jgi:biotin transporter BioY